MSHKPSWTTDGEWQPSWFPGSRWMIVLSVVLGHTECTGEGSPPQAPGEATEPGVGGDEVEAVKRPRVHMKLRRYAGTKEPAGVLDALVPKGLHLAHVDQGRWQPAQVIGTGRRRVRETPSPPTRLPSSELHPWALSLRSHTVVPSY